MKNKLSKMSIAKRKPIYDIGINDAPYHVYTTENGKRTICPYYSKWIHMFTRCYSNNYHKTHPTYIECIVCDEWYSFMSFRLWMSSKDWKDKELDKDLLVYGNKIYSPSTCIFISKRINSLLNSNKAVKGKYPQGVSWNKEAKKYVSMLKKYSKSCFLGYFDTEKEAEIVYLKTKSKHIKEIALEQEDQDLKYALLRYSNRLNKETIK